MATPTKAFLLPRNWVTDGDAVTFTGGSWELNLPLTRLASVDPRVRAWSTDAANVSTIIEVDLGQERTLNFLAALFTNMSQSAQIRYTIGNDDIFATYEYRSAWLPAYPVTQPFGQGAFGVFSFGGFQAVDANDPRGVGHNHFLGYAYSARYLRIEIDDDTNSDGVLKVGVVFAGYGEELTVQVKDGFNGGIREEVIADRAVSGALHIDPLYKVQTLGFEIWWEPKATAMARWYDMLADRGRSKPVLVFLLPDDELNLSRLGLYGIITEYARLTQMRNSYFGAAISMESL